MPFCLIQFLYGFNIFANEDKVFETLRRLLKISTIVNMIYLIVYSLTFTLNSPKNLFSYSIHLKSWIILITYFYFHFKFHKNRELFRQIESQLSKTDRRRMTRINCIFSTAWISTVTASTCLTVWVSFADTMNLVLRLVWGVFGFGWILVCVLFQTYLCSAIYLIEREILRQTKIDNKFNDNEEAKLNFEEVLQKFLSLEKLKQLIDDNLGLLPFLWFLELFCSTCLRLTQMASDNSSMITDRAKVFLDYFFEYTLLSIAYIFYIICLNYFQTRRPTKNDLIIWLKNKSTAKGCQLMANECELKFLLSQHLVHCYAINAYKAWNLFEIDMKFIFGFLGSVITFAVMGIQLINK